MRIGVDLISGESPMEELIQGCVDAVETDSEIEVVAIGKRDVYEPLLKQKKYAGKRGLSRISIMEASEVITMHDDPLTIVKQKKDSSIVKGLQAHKSGEIDAFFSPGNTGAVVVASAIILGRIKGVKKPALVAFIPNIDKKINIFLDVGASAECEVEDFAKFAILGRIYAKEMVGVENPRVALLNIGEESHKGTALAKETYKRLSEMDVNFIGNVEGRDIVGNLADVIVTDGNIGNITMKTAEGVSSTLFKLMKQAIKKSFTAQISLPFYGGVLKDLKESMDPEKYGGVPLLGVNGNVFIGHGNSGRNAIRYGILAAAHSVRSDVLGKINRRMEDQHFADN